VDTANEPAADILLMADPRVAAVPVHDCGEELVDVRSCGTLSLSGFRADDLGDFA
jgi:D-alanyl-D-alanine dipeptidase